MEAVYRVQNENPRTKSNIFSKLFFIWMMKLCYRGTKKTLQLIDLYKTMKCDESELLTNQLEKNWNTELNKANQKFQKPNLIRAITKTFFWKYMLLGLLLSFQIIFLRSFQPFVLGIFINLFSQNPTNQHEMYIFGSILVLQSFLIVLFSHHIDFGQASIGMRIRISISSLIYRKMLRLSKKSLEQTAAGQAVNLLSNDVNRFDFITLALHYLWIMPLQIILVTYLIWREMGISTLAGVLFMLCLTLPVQGYLAKLTSKLRLKTALRTDHRVRLMNEVISGIQIIKMYAWEKPFEKIVEIARKNEIQVITKSSYLRGVFLSCMVFIERSTLFLTVMCYVLLGNPITADRVFSIAQYFNLLQLAMAICYPMAISFGAETLVSIKRLEQFLLLEEKPESKLQLENNQKIVFQNINATWSETPTLTNLNLEIPAGSLCAIIGPVGSGKSSILQLLLGELAITSGSLTIGGSISYSSQEPWLFASTIRNNILFGREYDQKIYRKTIRACALLADFEQLPNGDKTLVGEKGVSLSGGQRARVNLARSIYRQADIYLLDDPLSAVDTHVGKHLFEECILKHLRDKTRILVTHQLQYLQQADQIIVLKNGTIEARGTFNELIASNTDFTKLIISEEEKPLEPNQIEKKLNRTESINSQQSLTSDTIETIEGLDNTETIDSSNSSPLKDYVKASGGCCGILCVITLLILAQFSCNAADLWVTAWTQQEEITIKQFNNTESSISLENRNFYMYIYSGIILIAVILTLTRSFAFFKMAMNSSKNLHNLMFHSLLQAPMRFFDMNPSGRVLNRFSKDMGAIDEFLPRVLIEAIQILLVMTGILVMIIIANYYMIIMILIVGFLFYKIRGWYLATARDVKLLEGSTKSNVFSHLNSSFNGITTIRATRSEKILMEEFDLHQDTHTAAWFLTIATKSCFGLWLDLLSVLFVSTVIIGFILLNLFSQITGSLVGLAISQSLILTGMLQYGMRQTAEVVNQLTSVERVMQYTKLDNEHTNLIPKKTQELWPTQGVIEFKNLTLQYSKTDSPVLRNLNFRIESGNKIGIVGRTGAGKSSLISALFRLAPTQGQILIDNIDTKQISLSDLRKNISIIPQEPVLFSATIRYNLDPFSEFNDEDLWNVLEEVELKDNIPSLSKIVSEGGSNFSLGQRQLVCLARAILRNNKILVLDEATANVDPRTDFLIQNTIRKKFQNCTVLTIAHRLNTIMDSDKVIVMSSGEMVEFDHPYHLLKNPDGYFTKMVAETGPAMAEQLKQVAQKSLKIV